MSKKEEIKEQVKEEYIQKEEDNVEKEEVK